MVANVGSKIIRGKFLTTYSLLEVHMYFYEIPRAKIRFFRYFRPKKRVFQIDEMVSECPKISIFSKSSLYTFLSQNSTRNPMQNSKKWSEHGKRVVPALFDSCFQHFWAKNTHFDVFLTFLPYYDHHAQYRGCAWLYKNRKISNSPAIGSITSKLS